MKPATSAMRILFVAIKKGEADPILGQLRAAGHLVSLVEDLEAAQSLLASNEFDHALFPAPALASLLEQRVFWEASGTEAWRKSTLGVVYDLRSLLRSLERSLKELQEGSAAESTALAGLDDVRRRISVLSAFLYELISELSNETGEELNLRQIDLEDAVEAAAVAVYPTASDRQARLAIDIDEEVARVRADSTKLKRVLANLLEYAVRNSLPLGTVTVRASRVGDQCVIAVADKGDGISQAELRRLFSPALERGDSGFGLSLVKRLVEKQGGQVWVESEKGSGTTVFISLPLLATVRVDELGAGVAADG